MGNHRIGRIQNGLGGAVILFQPNGAAAPILLFKAENVLDGGAPEPVNALVIIAYHADIFVTSRQQRGEQVLHVVGILVFIHQNISEFPLIVAEDILMLLQKLDSHIDNVIKIQRVVFFQLGLVFLIGLCNVFGPEITACFRRPKHFGGGDHLVLLAADGSKDIFGRKGLFVHVQLLQDALHHPFGVGGVVDGEAAGIAHGLNVPPQNPAAGGVEGHGPNILRLRPQQGGQTILDLVGGLVGEGDGNDAPGHRRFNGAEPVCPPAVFVTGIFRQSFQKRCILVG